MAKQILYDVYSPNVIDADGKWWRKCYTPVGDCTECGKTFGKSTWGWEPVITVIKYGARKEDDREVDICLCRECVEFINLSVLIASYEGIKQIKDVMGV